MAKLTELQLETIEYCKKQIDEARERGEIDIRKVGKRKMREALAIIEAQNGIVYTPGGRCTSRTLRALEKQGLLFILEDNSGIGLGGCGAFPSKVQILNY